MTIVFLILTAPVAAHMLGRAAYIVGVPLWHGTVRDDLKDQYDQAAQILKSPAPGSAEGVAEAGSPDGED